MTEQNNAAAERSAHVERGTTRRIPGESFLVETSPGVFQIKAVAEAIRERDEARAEAARLRRGWLTTIQAENSCPASDGGCLAKRCACIAEMEMLMRQDECLTPDEVAAREAEFRREIDRREGRTRHQEPTGLEYRGG